VSGEGVGKRPTGATSSKPRATPWVNGECRQRPARAKALIFRLLPLQGEFTHPLVPRALPWAWSSLAFQAVFTRTTINLFAFIIVIVFKLILKLIRSNMTEPTHKLLCKRKAQTSVIRYSGLRQPSIDYEEIHAMVNSNVD